MVAAALFIVGAVVVLFCPAGPDGRLLLRGGGDPFARAVVLPAALGLLAAGLVWLMPLLMVWLVEAGF